MNIAAIFLTGLTTGGVSCAAMQGGMVASLIANQKRAFEDQGVAAQTWLARKSVAIFLVAKLVVHILLGFGLGWLGNTLQLNVTMTLVFQTLAGVFMVASALNLLEVHPIFRYVVLSPPKWLGKWMKSTTQSQTVFAPFLLGVATLFVPCGVTQSMEVAAIATGSGVQGALTMGAFVAGTIPVFAVIGLTTAQLADGVRQKVTRVAAALLIVLAASAFNGVLTVLDSPFTFQKVLHPVFYFFSDERFLPKDDTLGVTQDNGVQKVHIAVENHGYTPDYFRVKVGQPVELTVETNDVYSCASAFTFKEFDIKAYLESTDSKTFTFTPQEKGRFTFACAMGMYTGVMEVL